MIVPPSEVSESPIVIPSLASFAFAIEPASCPFVTPPVLIDTAPDDTVKSADAKEATPFADAVASSPAIDISSSETVVVIPLPPLNVNVPPVLNVSLEPLSAASESVWVTVPKDSCQEPFVFKN